MKTVRPESSKKLGFTFILAGLCFFFNPVVELVDFLPDFIGCILMLKGLSMLRDVCEYENDARRGFRRLLWLSLSHIPAFFVMISIVNRHITEKMFMLLIIFIYSIIEAVLLCVTFNNFIDGFVYLGERRDNNTAFYLPGKPGKKKRQVAGLRGMLTAFFIVKAACEIAPELVHLQVVDEYAAYRDSSILLERYKTAFIVIAALVPLAFGIAVFVRIFRYVRAVSLDARFTDGILEEYRLKIKPDSKIFAYRRYSLVLGLMAAAAILCTDLYFDNVNVIPDFLAGGFFFTAACLMYRETQWRKGALAASAAYTVSGVICTVLSIRFTDSFSYEDVGHDDAADRLFSYLRLSTLITQVLFLFTVVLTVMMLTSVIRRVFAHDENALNPYTNNKNEYIMQSLIKKLDACAIIALLPAASGFLNLIFKASTQAVSMGGGSVEASVVYLPKFEAFWMLDLVIAVIWAVLAVTSFNAVRNELHRKFDIL